MILEDSPFGIRAEKVTVVASWGFLVRADLPRNKVPCFY